VGVIKKKDRRHNLPLGKMKRQLRKEHARESARNKRGWGKNNPHNKGKNKHRKNPRINEEVKTGFSVLYCGW